MKKRKTKKKQCCDLCGEEYSDSPYKFCPLCMGLLWNLQGRSGYTELKNTIEHLKQKITWTTTKEKEN